MSEAGDEPVDETGESARITVGALLSAAGIDVPAEECDRLSQLYPALRRSADRFYSVEAGDEVPAAIYRAGELR